jgi:hypothetical protein
MAGRAEPATPTRGQERRDDVVAGSETDDAGAHLAHDARSLVATDQRERRRKIAGADVLVGMAEAGRLPRHQDLAVARRIEIDLLDRPVAAVLPQNRRVGLHAGSV